MKSIGRMKMSKKSRTITSAGWRGHIAELVNFNNPVNRKQRRAAETIRKKGRTLKENYGCEVLPGQQMNSPLGRLNSKG